MNNIKKFTVENKSISIILFISILIILSYIFYIDYPEFFSGAEHWFNLVFELSIGYIINFIFYVTQVYIPNIKRNENVKKCISVRLDQLSRDMRRSISALTEIYNENHKGNSYTDKDLDLLLNLEFSDEVHVIDPRTCTRFSVHDWIKQCIYKTEIDIDKLFNYYSNDISVELMNVLEEILNSSYHSYMRMTLSADKVNFSDCNDNFFVPYYNLICELENINAKEYSYVDKHTLAKLKQKEE